MLARNGLFTVLVCRGRVALPGKGLRGAAASRHQARSADAGRCSSQLHSHAFSIKSAAGRKGEGSWGAGACVLLAGGGSGLAVWEEESDDMIERDQGEETFGEEEVVMYARVIGEEREIHYVFEGDEAGPMHEASVAEDPCLPNGTPPTDNKKGEGKVVNLEQEMLKRRKIIIFGPIDDRLAYSVCMKILYLEAEDPGKPIEMLINSPGGKVAAGLAIYDWMELVSSPIHTVCWGRAYSMAAILLAAGEKGHRIIMPNAKVMIHQPSVEIPRSVATDIMIRSREMQETKDQLKRILARHMEKAEEWVENASERDMYMKPEDAIKNGIVDRIATSLVYSKL